MALQQTKFVPPSYMTGSKAKRSKASEGFEAVGGIVGGVAGAMAGAATGGGGNIPGAIMGGIGGMQAGRTVGKELGERIDPSKGDTRQIVQPQADQAKLLDTTTGSSRTRALAEALNALRYQNPEVKKAYGQPLLAGYMASTAVDRGGMA